MQKKIRPVFIGGCPRSGTSLLAKEISRSKQIAYVPEANYILDVFRAIGKRCNVDTGRLVDEVSRHPRFKIWKHKIEKKRIINNIGKKCKIENGVNEITEDYIKTVHGGVGHKLWTNHSPRNILNGKVLSELFPASKFIHIVRDGRAAYSSVSKLDWGPFSVDDGAHWWSHNVGGGLALEEFLGNQKSRRVYYEELLQNTDQVLNNLFEWLDVDNAKVVDPNVDIPSYTHSQHYLLGDKPDKSRIDAWREEMKNEDIMRFESIVGDILEYHGYNRKYDVKSSQFGIWYKVELRSKKLYRQISSYIKRKYRKYKYM